MKVNYAIIPAAGLGTRFLPATKAIPKPMLTVIDTPSIQYIVEEAVNAGIENIAIIVSSNSDVIKNHFSENKVLEDRLIADGKKELYDIAVKTRTLANIVFIEQKVQNGLAGAILSAKDFVKDNAFAVLLGDELIYQGEGDRPSVKCLTDIYEKTGKNVIATMYVSDDDVSKYGNVGISKTEGEIFYVNGITEKPKAIEKLSNYAIIGRYVFAGGIMDRLLQLKPRNGEIYLTDTLHDFSAEGKLLATKVDGIRYDVGDKFGYLKANVEYALRSDELKEETKKLIKNIAEKL